MDTTLRHRAARVRRAGRLRDGRLCRANRLRYQSQNASEAFLPVVMADWPGTEALANRPGIDGGERPPRRDAFFLS